MVLLSLSVSFIAVGYFSFAISEPIIGGSDASQVAFKGDIPQYLRVLRNRPYMVHIIIMGSMRKSKAPSFILCGGIIISKDAVLTAACCLEWSEHRPNALVTAGITHINLERGREQAVLMRDYVVHSKFTKNSQKPSEFCKYQANNIAIIWLNQSLTFNEKVENANLVDPDTDIKDKFGFLLGWGDTEHVMIPPMLQKGVLKVLSQEACEESYPGFNITEEVFCAISPNKLVMGCTGDNGDPFIVENKVVGLLSFFSVKTSYSFDDILKPCDPTKPAVLTNLGKFRRWIEYNLLVGAPMNRTNETIPFEIWNSSASFISYPIALLLSVIVFFVLY